MISRRLLGVFSAVFVLACLASPAHAALQLRLTSALDPTGVTVADLDNDGFVNYSGVVGGFSINVSTGLSTPAAGTATPNWARMDLNSIDTTTGGQFGGQADTLKIELTDTDFPAFPTPGILEGFVGGTTNNEVEFWAYKNSSNVAFDTTNADAEIHLGAFGPGAFSGTATDLHAALGSYSMTLVALITHSAVDQLTSFDFEVVNVVPEPATFLSALPLLIGGFFWTRRRRA